MSRLLSSRTFLLINLVILGFLIFSFGREFISDYSIRQEIAALEAEKTVLENENSEIISLMNSIQTETYIEREARIKLGLAKPGENVVVLSNSDNKQTQTEVNYAAEITTQDLSSIANYRKWWYYFFDINKFDMIKIYGK